MTPEEAARAVDVGGDIFICLLYLVTGAFLFALVGGLTLFGAWLFGFDLERMELPRPDRGLASLIAVLVILVFLIGAFR